MRILLFVLLSLIITGCEAKQPPKNVEIVLPEVQVVAKKEPVEEIKEPEPEKTITHKKVCIKVYDSKLKKEVEKCKVIKTHKKYEGKKVPVKK
jgi:hypothetical protein